MMVKIRRSLPFVRCTVPAVGILAITILVASFLCARQATALPLCVAIPEVQCREDVEAGIEAVIESLVAGVPNERHRKSAVTGFDEALDNFESAREAIANTHLTAQDRCRGASTEDHRALNRTSGAVSDTFSLPAHQFSSADAFTATRTVLEALVSSMIDAVDNNLNEIESIGTGFDPKHVAEARRRLDRARNSMAQGNLAGAADHVRGAYDVVDGDGNVAPDCLIIVPETARSKLVEGTPAANYAVIWDGRLSRSATPNDEAQWRWLRAQGVNTIVSLDPQRMNFGSFGFENYLWIPLDEGAPPTDIQAVRFLKFVQDPDNKPVNLQSAGGSNRIATLRALLSYAIDGQTMAAASAEARLHNEGNELYPAQVEWLRRWADANNPGSHRRQ